MSLIENNSDAFYNNYVNIEINLIALQKMSCSINYLIPAERKTLFDEVLVIKQGYKNIECFLTNKTIQILVLPAMRMYISRIIHPKQMEAWIKKLYQNIQNFKNNFNTKTDVEKILFIQDQYRLLDTIIKVLNGDAYFVGCQQITKD